MKKPPLWVHCEVFLPKLHQTGGVFGGLTQAPIRICGPENFGFEIYAPEKLMGEMDDFGPPLRTPLSRSHLASSSGLLWMLYM